MLTVTDAPLLISIQGQGASQRVEHALPLGAAIRIGRNPADGWSIAWDKMISREHADLSWDVQRLRVEVLPQARNPLLYQGKPTKLLAIEPGDWFQIGQSTFQTRVPQPVPDDATGSTAAFRFGDALGFSSAGLRKVQFQNAAQQLELLADLPAIIRQSLTDEALCAALSKLLLTALPQATAVAVAHYDLASLPADEQQLERFPQPLTMRMELRAQYREAFRPSRRMVWQTLKQECSLMHILKSEGEDTSVTHALGLGWAFCCPVRGDATQGWCLYVAGRGSRTGEYIITEEMLTPDLRFSELVAQFLGSIRHVRLLQEQKTQLGTFFSPKVLQSLSDVRRSNELLSPAERNVSVLFCDVRGFSRKSEALQGELLELLHSVSGALQVMAGAIQDHDGTIADFQGDAALGFWGWPVATENGPLPACQAALQIERAFRQGNAIPGGPLDGYAIGIGIAHGRAIAGQIGTVRQAKVGVFGPVVNQGSRLEGLTKQFGVSICVDEATATFVKAALSTEVAVLRRLGTFRPKGMDAAVQVSALLPPFAESTWLTAALLEQHELAVAQVIAGHWSAARAIFETFPATDGPSQRLLALMAETDHTPPPEWDGTFTLTKK
jgi:adenylate cyclase